MASNLVISKNSVSVTLHTQEVTDNYTNKLFLITPPQTKANQSSGPQDNRIINLMRNTHELVIRAEITADSSQGLTAVQVKNNLISIFNGAGANGGVVNLTYEGYSGGIDGHIERLTFLEKPTDEPATMPDDYAKYTVTLTFVEGVET